MQEILSTTNEVSLVNETSGKYQNIFNSLIAKIGIAFILFLFFPVISQVSYSGIMGGSTVSITFVFNVIKDIFFFNAMSVTDGFPTIFILVLLVIYFLISVSLSYLFFFSYKKTYVFLKKYFQRESTLFWLSVLFSLIITYILMVLIALLASPLFRRRILVD